MNFIGLLNSLDELLYEVLSWVLFFPITLWRALTRPISTMRYAEAQLALPDDDQCTETLSPPIFLVLALLLSQALSISVDGANPLVASKTGLAALITDNTTLLIVRAIVFGIFPLVFATWTVRTCKKVLTRDSLRPFFYAQCLPAGAFALLLSVGTTLTAHPLRNLGYAGGMLMASGTIYYLVTQTRWFAVQGGRTLLRGFLHAIVAFIVSVLVVIAASLLLVA